MSKAGHSKTTWYSSQEEPDTEGTAARDEAQEPSKPGTFWCERSGANLLHTESSRQASRGGRRRWCASITHICICMTVLSLNRRKGSGTSFASFVLLGEAAACSLVLPAPHLYSLKMRSSTWRKTRLCECIIFHLNTPSISSELQSTGLPSAVLQLMFTGRPYRFANSSFGAQLEDRRMYKLSASHRHFPLPWP